MAYGSAKMGEWFLMEKVENSTEFDGKGAIMWRQWGAHSIEICKSYLLGCISQSFRAALPWGSGFHLAFKWEGRSNCSINYTQTRCEGKKKRNLVILRGEKIWKLWICYNKIWKLWKKSEPQGCLWYPRILFYVFFVLIVLKAVWNISLLCYEIGILKSPFAIWKHFPSYLQSASFSELAIWRQYVLSFPDWQAVPFTGVIKYLSYWWKWPAAS